MESRREYTKSIKWQEAINRQVKKFDDINDKYWNQFVKTKKVSISSLPQYKSSFNRFCKHIDKDVLDSNTKDLEGKTKENASRYIKSVLINAIISNEKKVSKDLVEMVIPSEYISIFNKMK